MISHLSYNLLHFYLLFFINYHPWKVRVVRAFSKLLIKHLSFFLLSSLLNFFLLFWGVDFKTATATSSIGCEHRGPWLPFVFTNHRLLNFLCNFFSFYWLYFINFLVWYVLGVLVFILFLNSGIFEKSSKLKKFCLFSNQKWKRKKK